MISSIATSLQAALAAQGEGGDGSGGEEDTQNGGDIVEDLSEGLSDLDIVDVNWWLTTVLPSTVRAVLIVVLLLILRYALFKAIDRAVDQMATRKKPQARAAQQGGQQGLSARVVIGDDVIAAQRLKLRAHTVGTMLKSIGNAVIMVLLILLVLSQFGFNLAPLLAGAGIVGVALGFGAQSVVADFMSGLFMLIEDQYGVGDIIDMAEASGVVEDVGLRVTRLRAVDGVVWYVRNGEIVRIGNMSQGWSRSVLDIGFGYSEDVARVKRTIHEVAHDMAEDPEWSELFLEQPQVLGLEELAADAVVLRLSVMTKPGEQWAVSRELRERLKARFDEEGIEIPFPQRTVWMRTEDDAKSNAGAKPPTTPDDTPAEPAPQGSTSRVEVDDSDQD